jgi:hypothetical protein
MPLLLFGSAEALPFNTVKGKPAGCAATSASVR